ncbi:MAG: cysteine rich repeat-containing protein [Elusimicrobiales bacterium]
MNKDKLLLMALTAGFALALTAPAAAEGFGKGPCAADAAKFCKDVKPGEGRVAACLKEHEKELSQACLDRKALKSERRAGKRGGGKAAWKQGGNACMRQYGRGFGAGFRSGFKMRAGLGAKGMKGAGMRGGKAGRNRGGGVCAADAAKLCGDVKPGEGRVKACLQKNLDKLSEGCKTRQEKLKVRLEEKKKA